MNDKKQIEEMARILSEDCGSCENCKALGSTDDGIDCTDHYYARQLFNAGYRKQSDLTPCDVCRFNPPSCADGKPCSVCPAQAKGGEE